MTDVTERGVAVLSSTIDNGNGLFPNRYFDAMYAQLRAMGVQVHPFRWADLAQEHTRQAIIKTFSTLIMPGNDGGGPAFDHGEMAAEFKRRYGFIIDFNGKGFFVCRGAQFRMMLGGAKLETGSFPERGWTPTEIIDRSNPLFRGVSQKIDIYGAHEQRIDPNSLPAGYRVIASSPNCTVNVVQIAPEQWASQNHPEFGESDALALVRNLLY